MNSLKKPLNTGVQKVDSARAPYCQGMGVSFVSRCLRVSRAQLHVILRRADDWKGRNCRSRHTDDTDVCFAVYTMLSESCPHGYRRYGRCFADRPNLMVCLRSMPNVFTGIMRQNALLLERKPLYRHRNGHIQAEWL